MNSEKTTVSERRRLFAGSRFFRPILVVFVVLSMLTVYQVYTLTQQVNGFYTALKAEQKAKTDNGEQTVAPPADEIAKNPDVVEGKQGAPGVQGVQGSQGVQGIQGVPGQNATDAMVLNMLRAYCSTRNDCVGADGKNGTNGINGVNGIDGKDGVGIQGPKGDTGDPGVNGKDGTDGADGRSVTGVSSVCNEGDLPTSNDNTMTLTFTYSTGDPQVFTFGIPCDATSSTTTP